VDAVRIATVICLLPQEDAGQIEAGVACRFPISRAAARTVSNAPPRALSTYPREGHQPEANFPPAGRCSPVNGPCSPIAGARARALGARPGVRSVEYLIAPIKWHERNSRNVRTSHLRRL